jgi:hypothetical protein
MEEKTNIKDLFIRQNEYFQYLYEQEQKRAMSIIAGAKIYIAFLVFILGSILLKVISPDKLIALFNNGSIPRWEVIIGISLSVLSAMALSIALLFSILVMKVWQYDRLCCPIERFRDTLNMNDEIEVLSKSICDFAVATHRNNEINNKRAKYLSYALGFLLIGTVFALITASTLNFIIRGG